MDTHFNTFKPMWGQQQARVRCLTVTWTSQIHGVLMLMSGKQTKTNKTIKAQAFPFGY